MMQRAAELGLADVVTFTGLVAHDAVPRYLAAADIAVVPYPLMVDDLWLSPLKLFEYMASGRPILFGSQGGEAVRELTDAGGALSFKTDDVQNLCDMILRLKSGEIDGERLGEKYQDHAIRNHHRDRWAQQYIDQLQKM
jgi:glycosyltransferase involved in cell wall biosynthesis